MNNEQDLEPLMKDREIAELVGMSDSWVRQQRSNRKHNKHHVFTTPIMHEEFKGIRITPNVYTTLGELDRFCNLMESIARNGLPT